MSRETRVLIVVAALCIIGLGLRTLSYEALMGVLVGAAISAGFSWYYYQQASNDLKVEAEELREATERVLRILQTTSGGGKARPIWDERGRSKGVAHEIGIGASSDSTASHGPRYIATRADPKPRLRNRPIRCNHPGRRSRCRREHDGGSTVTAGRHSEDSGSDQR